MIQSCTAEGCTAKHLARGLCSKHYYRAQRHGELSLHPLIYPLEKKPVPCAAADCNQEAMVRGLCSRHYQRARYRARRGVPVDLPPQQGRPLRPREH